MPLLEIDIEESVCKWAEENGWLAAKLQWLNQTGWPDRTFIKGGIVAFIEFKKPGGRLSAKQKYWIGILKSFGVPVSVQDDVLTAKFWLENLYLESQLYLESHND